MATGTVDRVAIELEGLATSIILSAISASVARVVPCGVEAKNIRTACGNRWRNSSRKKEGSTPGRSLAIVAFYGGAVLVFDHLAPRL